MHKRPFAFLVISIAILLLRFSPDHLGDFLWAVFVVILIEFANRYSRVYGALRWFQKIKGIIFEWNLKRKIKKSIKNKQEETYLKVLIENALENAKSTDVIERKLGLEQLSQLEMGDYYVYEKLLEILKSGVDKQHEEQIIDTLYKISKM